MLSSSSSLDVEIFNFEPSFLIHAISSTCLMMSNTFSYWGFILITFAMNSCEQLPFFSSFHRCTSSESSLGLFRSVVCLPRMDGNFQCGRSQVPLFLSILLFPHRSPRFVYYNRLASTFRFRLYFYTCRSFPNVPMANGKCTVAPYKYVSFSRLGNSRTQGSDATGIRPRVGPFAKKTA